LGALGRREQSKRRSALAAELGIDAAELGIDAAELGIEARRQESYV
jgi:hypothetical protein